MALRYREMFMAHEDRERILYEQISLVARSGCETQQESKE
jgi:hypothetical protein